MRAPQKSDFNVDVQKIGLFVFARRTIRDNFSIRGEYNRLTNGNYDSDGNVGDLSALAFVTINYLAVSQPEGFSINDLDPVVDDNVDDKLLTIFAALREKEAAFRPGHGKELQADRKGDGERLRVDVSPPLQPAAD